MKLTLIQYCIAIIFAGVSYANKAVGQELLNKKVSIRFENQSFESVLAALEKQTEATFTYRPKLVSKAQKINFSANNEPLEQVLDKLFSPLKIKYKVFNKNIILSRLETTSLEVGKENVTFDESTTQIKTFANVVPIKGVISDESGEKLPGVSITIKGTTQGSTTDINGNFSLEVPDSKAILVFSFVGFLTQEIEVGNRTIFNVILKVDNKTLDEIIVVGYGSQKKADLTGSVASVNVDQMLTRPAADVSNMLQGRVAGVVASGSNQPGGEGYVRIRGISSFGSNEPLVIIDGVQTSGTNSINPNDIESMNILKDASSAAIYGARGAGGVIIITTKKGKADKTRISYDAFYGVSNVTKYPTMLNTAQYGELIWKQQLGAGLVPSSSQFGKGASPVIPDYVLAGTAGGLFEGNPLVDPSKYNYDQTGFYQIVKANKVGTDWFKESTQAAPVLSHNLSASGGNDKSIYSLSLGYYSEAGLQKYTFYDRYSIRANSEYKLSKKIRFGETLFGSYRNRVGSLDNDEFSPWSQAFRMQPITPVYDIMGNFAGSKGPGTGNGSNPVAHLYRAKDNSNKDVRLLASLYAEVDIIKNLKARSSFGIDYNNNYNTTFTDINPEWSEGSFQTSLSLASGYQYRWTFSNTLNYDKQIAKHKFNAMAGIESVDYKREQLGGNRSGYYPFTSEDFRVLDRGNPIGQNNSSSISVESLYSNFGRIDYSYNDKYLLNATVRRDGSSKFAKETRFGVFPSISAGWRISDENFMKNLTFISDLKLRVGYGKVGNDQIDANNQYTFYRSDPARSFYDIKGSNGSTTQGYDLDRKGNPGSKWEETATINGGLDFSLFNNALEINVDVYNKKTSDLLVQIPRPGTEGDFTAPFVNIGNTENKGFDISFLYRGKAASNKLSYSVSTNISAYKNKVSSEGVDFFTNQVRYALISRTVSGQPIGQFFGYKIDGFFNDVAEVMAAPTQAGVNKTTEANAKASVGRWRYKDQNNDGKIDANDRVFLGSPHPKFQMGFNGDLNYQNWDFNMFFFWNYGNQIYNNTKWWTDLNGSFAGNRSLTMLNNSWSPENKNALLPKLDANDNVTSSVPNDYYVESGSYFRAKTMQLGYTLPKKLLSSVGVSKLRLYVQGQNLFTITKYTGPDPDLLNVGRGDIGLGVDHGRVPNPRQILGGLNLTF